MFYSDDSKIDNLIRHIANKLIYNVPEEQIINDLKIGNTMDELYLAISAAKILNKYR